MRPQNGSLSPASGKGPDPDPHAFIAKFFDWAVVAPSAGDVLGSLTSLLAPGLDGPLGAMPA